MAENERMELTRVVMQLFADWGVSPRDQAAVLGLNDADALWSLARHRQGRVFPESADLDRRLSLVLTVAHRLRTVFPHTRAMADYWVTTPHPCFNEQTPLQVMASGLDGLEAIVEYLNASGRWG